MNAFAAGKAYDPAVNKLPGFATISYTEPVVERLSPLAVHLMRDSQRMWQR
jgi:hypothetical protein